MAKTMLTIRGHPYAGPRRLAALAIALLAGPASGCGLEGDPIAVEKLAVSYVYPDSLNVMAAVSTARLAGKLDRTITIGSQTPEQLERTSLRIRAALWQLRARLARAPSGAAPSLAIVLLEPMMWSRIATAEEAPKLLLHVDGPATGDVVAVTEEVVLVAINEDKISAGEALSLGLVRLYGSDGDVASARTWLQATDNFQGRNGS
jgi:hypothetical protein